MYSWTVDLKHRSAAIIILFCIFVILPASAESSPEILRIIQKGKIAVAIFAGDIPPFFMDDGKGGLYGMDIELVRLMAKELGVEVEFRRHSRTFYDIVDELLEHNADIAIGSINRTMNNAMQIAFSNPYVVIHHAFLINRLELVRARYSFDPLGFISNEQFKLGFLAGQSQLDFVQNSYPTAYIIPYESWQLATEDILKGEIHALVSNEIRFNNWLYDHPEVYLHFKHYVLENKLDPISIAVHWKNKDLLSWINAFLSGKRQDGTLKRLENFYLNGDQWRTP